MNLPVSGESPPTSPVPGVGTTADQLVIAAVAACPHRKRPRGCCGPALCVGGQRAGQTVTFEACAACIES
jgi:hypothetical protein